ncbi:MAG: Unknown protein [uncultured Sulfurovum sp.]|uniref:Antitoxin n=1 Tax=uncultured Sulfurovum sp. TaxID=269237 RepID=A0A6S6U0C8_9BACT|nr:MAG: Unknown protein [uncultured Sulfurovum sp.]
MTAKITLYSDKNLIEQIKVYAKEQNTSVSKIVNEFFTNLLETQDIEPKKNKITDSLVGALKDKNVEENHYHDYLENKYS